MNIPLALDKIKNGVSPTVNRSSDLTISSLGIARWMLVLGAFFAGYHILRIGDVNVTLADALILSAFAIFLAHGKLNTRPFGELTPFWIAALVMMLGGLFISTLINGNMLRWFIVAGQYSIGFLLIPMLLTALTREFVRRMAISLLIGITVMELIGIFAVLTIDHVQASAIFSTEFIAGNGRLGSFAGEPNWNGQLITYAIIIMIYSAIKRLLPFWAILVIAPVLIWSLLLCASFTAFSATVIAVSILLVLLGWRYLLGFAAAILLGALLFFASGAPLPEIFDKRVGTAILSGDLDSAGTFNGRTSLIAEAWEYSDETSFVGLGVDQFRERSLTRQPVHNLYLLMWTEGGLISLLGLVGIMALMGLMALARLRDMRKEAAVALSIIFVYLAYTMASPHMFARFTILPVMLSLAMLYGRTSLKPAARIPNRR